MAAPSPSKDLEDYWNEIHAIEHDAHPASDDDELSKTPDEGEIEAAWLDAAGYGFVVNTFEDGKDYSDGELDTLTHSLTRAQAQAVRKRIDTLSTTMRRKHRVNKVHVKDIFPRQGDPSQDSIDDTDVQLRPQPRHHMFKPNSDPLSHGLRSKGGGYTLPGNTSPTETGVEMLGFHPKPDSSHTNNGDQFSHLPSVSDIEISIDFHLEETDNKPPLILSTIPDPHRVDLPAFEPKPDPLGITYVSDLAACDMAKIKALAHIELTALFDHYGVIYSRPKRRKKVKDHGIFGVPLDVLMTEDQKRSPKTKIPLVFQAMMTFLEKDGLHIEGILRLSGSESRVKQLRHDLEEKFYAGLFSWGDASPHDVAAVMKQFLRELPIPLLSYQYLDAFPQVSNIPKTLEQLKALNLLILLLAEEHRNLLKALLSFLREVVSHSNENRMGLSNVGMIMAPNLFPSSSGGHHKDKEKLNLMLELKKASVTSNMVKMLIHYQDILWTVPSTFIGQIRHQYTNEAHRKSKEKLLIRLPWKKDKDRSDVYKKPAPSPDQPEVQDGVIRVQAPHLTKSSALIQLDQFTTAADVVSKFKCDEGLLSREDSTIGEPEESDGHIYRNPNNAHYAHDRDYLFEVGGNIAERCLDPMTKMLKLYHVNPTAEWVIRVKEGR